MQIFGPEGKAADVQGYESDDGPSSGGEADDNSFILNSQRPEGQANTEADEGRRGKQIQ